MELGEIQWVPVIIFFLICLALFMSILVIGKWRGSR